MVDWYRRLYTASKELNWAGSESVMLLLLLLVVTMQ